MIQGPCTDSIVGRGSNSLRPTMGREGFTIPREALWERLPHRPIFGRNELLPLPNEVFSYQYSVERKYIDGESNAYSVFERTC